MKRWEKYERYLQKGDWHVHTNYTDGKNSIFDCCEQAEKNRLELIAFTEHVRKILDYDFNDFMSDVYSAKDKFDLEVIGGCETKVLDSDGNLDVSEDILKQCEIVLGVFHTFEPVEKNTYLMALRKTLTNPEVDIWAHPTLWTKKHNISLDLSEICNVLKLSSKSNVLIEKNLKYGIPDQTFLKIASNSGCKTVIGSDAHNINELLKL